MNERSIFEAAIEKQTVAERSAFLDEACGGDEELRRRVDVLLRQFERPDPLLDSPPSSLAATAFKGAESTGTAIGAYKLREQIGEGGMGVVYVAEQEQPVRRKVALKIIKLGMDTKEVIARFEAERQALAIMDHPNIARVLDAGTTESGRPYFVMELVRGIPITEHCDKKKLSTHERLRLFCQVCQAVQHAHQKGIIHRDLKPSNVLVALYGGVPVPKVIDFGVAKATNQRLTEATVYTRMSQIIGTPLYMSPEQAELSGSEVDTRTDIYSLGVLLYELLTGSTPFTNNQLTAAGYDEMRRIIREQDPPKPSDRVSTLEVQRLSTVASQRGEVPRRLTESIRGELDWIVMKSLEKEADRRYESASAFASDVERYLNNEAVAACPPSAAYRLRKFAARNRAALLTAVSVAVALLCGLFGTAWQAARVTHALRDKQSAFQEREEALTAVTANMALADTERQRAESNLQLAMQAIDEAYLQSVGVERLLRESDHLDTFASEEIAGGTTLARLPALSGEERVFLRKGIQFYDRLARQNPASRQARFESAKASSRLGLLYAGLDENELAQKAYQAAIAKLESLNKNYPAEKAQIMELGRAYYQHGHLSRWWPGASDTFEKAVNSLSRAIELDPEDAAAYELRSKAGLRLKRYANALADYRSVVELDSNNAVAHFRLARLYTDIGDPSLQNRDLAIQHYMRSLELDPSNLLTRNHLAMLHRRRSDTESALAVWREGLKLTTEDHEKHEIRSHISEILQKYRETVDNITKVLESGREPRATNIADLYLRRGHAYLNLAQLDEAHHDLTRAAELALSESVLLQISGMYKGRSEYETALQFIERAEELNPNNSQVYSARGDILWHQGFSAAALAEFERSVSLSPNSSYLYKRRGRVLFEVGQYEKALADIVKALELKPDDESAWYWIAPSDVAECPDNTFREGLLEFAGMLIDKGDTSGYFGRAVTRMAMGEHDKALEDLQAVIVGESAVDGDSKLLEHAYSRRATVHKELGRMAEAIEDYSRCIEIGFNKGLRLVDRGNLYRQIDDYKRAIEDYRGHLRFHPDCPGTLEAIAWLLVTCLGEEQHNVLESLAHAKKAAALSSKRGFLTTLGVAHYYAGDFKAAIEVLGKSETRRQSILNGLFLAMAHWKLDHKTEARRWYKRAVEQMQDSDAEDAELRRFRSEARALLEIPEDEKREKIISSSER